jgi:hypothetical protein
VGLHLEKIQKIHQPYTFPLHHLRPVKDLANQRRLQLDPGKALKGFPGNRPRMLLQGTHLDPQIL